MDARHAQESRDIEALAEAIGDLPQDFHDAGVLGKEVLLAFCDFSRGRDIQHSVETGSGKSTLLLSWISRHHQVFTLGEMEGRPMKSLTAVQDSPLFNQANVEFILGPTQQTLPRHGFKHDLQLAFLDGPHGFPFPQLEYYFIYPHLQPDALLVLDDVHIPTIAQLEAFLREDVMFEHLATVASTAFFRRTSAPVFDPLGDGWHHQNYNRKRFERLRSRYYQRTFRSGVYDFLEACFGKSCAEKTRQFYRRIVGKSP